MSPAALKAPTTTINASPTYLIFYNPFSVLNICFLLLAEKTLEVSTKKVLYNYYFVLNFVVVKYRIFLSRLVKNL